MNNPYLVCGWALFGAIATTPLPALAELAIDRSSEIVAAVDGAMARGDNEPLKTVLAAVVTADANDAGAAAKVATQRIASDTTRDTADQAKIVTANVITTLVAAAPAQAGAVLGVAQSSLPPDLQTAAISAAQSALSPAAGGKVMISKTYCVAEKKGLPCRTWQVPLNRTQ
jgi:hypothetical protein